MEKEEEKQMIFCPRTDKELGTALFIFVVLFVVALLFNF